MTNISHSYNTELPTKLNSENKIIVYFNKKCCILNLSRYGNMIFWKGTHLIKRPQQAFNEASTMKQYLFEFKYHKKTLKWSQYISETIRSSLISLTFKSPMRWDTELRALKRFQTFLFSSRDRLYQIGMSTTYLLP